MTPTETTTILRQFNAWRRGDDEDIPQPASHKITAAIDAAVEMIERMGGMEAALRLAVRQNSHDLLMTGDELRQCDAALEKAK